MQFKEHPTIASTYVLLSLFLDPPSSCFIQPLHLVKEIFITSFSRHSVRQTSYVAYSKNGKLSCQENLEAFVASQQCHVSRAVQLVKRQNIFSAFSLKEADRRYDL